MLYYVNTLGFILITSRRESLKKMLLFFFLHFFPDSGLAYPKLVEKAY